MLPAPYLKKLNINHWLSSKWEYFRDNIIAKITAKDFADKVNKISPMMTESAKERYLSFIEKSPTLANRIRFLFWLYTWESHNPS